MVYAPRPAFRAKEGTAGADEVPAGDRGQDRPVLLDPVERRSAHLLSYGDLSADRKAGNPLRKAPMSRIVVIGGTGYAGSAIVAEAAARGHEVTAFSRSLPDDRVQGVNCIQGDATDEATLASVISGADVVVAALAPRGPLA
jgi:lactate dehydrogenase-like 2-hydroxyacid dehydrogenase